MSSNNGLAHMLPLLRPHLPRLLLAIALGAASLGSALALAAVSAWLITRAWQMPPILDLSIAVVAVRAFGISRGVLGYCERLASHDTALRAAGSTRRQIYFRLARGPIDDMSRLPSGELLTRAGSDVDAIADVLVRAIVPMGVAVLLSAAAISLIALTSPAAAVVLAVCLIIAGAVSPWLAARAVRSDEQAARQFHSERDIAAVTALDHALELRVAGRLPGLIADAKRHQRSWGAATDRANAPAAAAAAVPTLAIAASVIGSVVVALGIANSTAPTTLAVLMLLPLSAFEATAMLPAAAVAWTRAQIAAARLGDLTATAPHSEPPVVIATPPVAPRIVATELIAGYPQTSGAQPVSIELKPGARLIITGESGSGKTSLLMTLAGLLPPIDGALTYGDRPIGVLTESQIRSAVSFFAEDAHLFTTTVRDNLLVARGDCSDDELTTALHTVGLSAWLDALPDGLNTVLTGGASAVSGGQRRRLLLARVLVSPTPVVLLDEPTEHLDRAAADKFLRGLLSSNKGILGTQRTVVVATHHTFDGDTPCPRLFIKAAGDYSGMSPGTLNCRSSVHNQPEAER